MATAESTGGGAAQSQRRAVRFSDAPGFALVFQRLDGAAVVRVRGEVDHETAPYLGAALSDLIRGQGNLTLTLDLAEMTFIDSSGLNVLVQALKWSRERGGTITLAKAQPHTAKVFEVVGFDKTFEITT